MSLIARPMGRIPFFATVSILNTVILFAVITSLGLRPAGAGHAAVLIIVGTLQAIWFVLHARRFNDAGKSAFWPVVVTGLAFAGFALGYLVLAALWSSPEYQREAFRTAGGIADHVESNPGLIEAGRLMVDLIGIAGALFLSGAIWLGMGLIALICGFFSLFALVLPGGRTRVQAVPHLPQAIRRQPQ
ncbi:MAG: hypothetical protein IOC90_14435 [Methylocystis sp.]|nr:hypothetical protein [Methylocystis sp.]MCA3586107.1 hypothetical protein [Methylocystis sp.]MCA3589211.1 hypothetical protein [Methylocystis sp.]MCA3593505.1 hypothetical protein [Methylocystis sp.]